MYGGHAEHPVFIALRGTVERHAIPEQPFADLIRAFIHDQTVTRYRNWDEVLDYCVYSANPVGRLVLYLCGYSDAERQRLSDSTCTALQLANFWQDVAVDLGKDRVYLPLDLLARHDYTVEDLFARRLNPSFRTADAGGRGQSARTVLEGLPLSRMVDRRLALDLELFSRGGLCVLDKIARQGYDVLSRRPKISKPERVAHPGRDHAAHGVPEGGVNQPALERSYAWCRNVARTRAKNFYYSFVLLSREQKNAMCAVYAFMRYCDDLSDEPGATRAKIERWREALNEALAGRFDQHPMWPAFHERVTRFQIPHRYFHEMIDGVMSDLDPRPVATFADLYAYCYKVASVVGLTIIHIFGFDDPQAPELAEKCGIAFQITNILRDVQEDADLGRQYLPNEDLARFGVRPEDLREGNRSEGFLRLMEFEAARAREYFDRSWPLVPMVHARSRSSLWALITIYSRLLDRIRQSNYDVLARRISLSGWEKSLIVMRAVVRT